MDLAGRHQQADQCREDNQRHDTRLEQREEVARIAIVNGHRCGIGQSFMFVGHCHGQFAFPYFPEVRGPDMSSVRLQTQTAGWPGGLFLIPAAQALT
ncbi:hypothetical protein OEG86_10760 [Hoeflea alexandrii]|uniref:hypothetical protein n=1 Tax=Hoeflea alexandrii TaxID=288436 RepID=UPI00226DAE11|nr:hypothetical protein [Hoeflea alexandrii]MCY0152634.1 hypothetical protein [Hoeflea alexandrii]